MAWKELGILVGVLVVWFSLMRFVLPAMGVPTCMSGACGVGPVGSCIHTGQPRSDRQPAEDAPGESEKIFDGIPSDAGPDGL